MPTKLLCQHCGEQVETRIERVPKYGGFGGMVTEHRCSKCNRLLAST